MDSRCCKISFIFVCHLVIVYIKQKRLDRKEDELAEAEAVRIRKLKLEGLVPMSAENGADEYGHVTGGSGKRSKEKRKRGHKSRVSVEALNRKNGKISFCTHTSCNIIGDTH